jgi:hypothetical protein
VALRDLVLLSTVLGEIGRGSRREIPFLGLFYSRGPASSDLEWDGLRPTTWCGEEGSGGGGFLGGGVAGRT